MRRVTVNDVLEAYKKTGLKFETTVVRVNNRNDTNDSIIDGSAHPLVVLAIAEDVEPDSLGENSNKVSVNVFEAMGLHPDYVKGFTCAFNERLPDDPSILTPQELLGYEDGSEVREALLLQAKKGEAQNSEARLMAHKNNASRCMATFSTNYLGGLRLMEEVLARYLRLVGSAVAIANSGREVDKRLQKLIATEREFVDKALTPELREAYHDYEEIESIRLTMNT